MTASCPSGTRATGISTSSNNISAVEIISNNKVTAKLKAGKNGGTYKYTLTCKS